LRPEAPFSVIRPISASMAVFIPESAWAEERNHDLDADNPEIVREMKKRV